MHPKLCIFSVHLLSFLMFWEKIANTRVPLLAGTKQLNKKMKRKKEVIRKKWKITWSHAKHYSNEKLELQELHSIVQLQQLHHKSACKIMRSYPPKKKKCHYVYWQYWGEYNLLINWNFTTNIEVLLAITGLAKFLRK